MANKRIEIMDVKQMLQLKVAGKSNRLIGELLGRSRNTINDYIKLFKQLDQSLEELSLLPLSGLVKILDALKTQKNTPKDERYENLEKHKGYY